MGPFGPASTAAPAAAETLGSPCRQPSSFGDASPGLAGEGVWAGSSRSWVSLV